MRNEPDTYTGTNLKVRLYSTLVQLPPPDVMNVNRVNLVLVARLPKHESLGVIYVLEFSNCFTCRS